MAIDAGYVQNTSFTPEEKFTKEPELLDERTVVLDNVVPDAVYVPIPTSHSDVPWPEIE
jgi:hypothetical protein